MSLTQNDLEQIEKIIDKRVGLSEKRLTKKIEDEVGSLAAMTAREFDRVHKKLKSQDKQFEKNG